MKKKKNSPLKKEWEDKSNIAKEIREWITAFGVLIAGIAALIAVFK